MAEEINWFCLKKKNSQLVLGRVYANSETWLNSRNSKLELIEPTFPNKKDFRGIIGCFEDEMKLEYAEEIEKFDLEVVELKDE